MLKTKFFFGVFVISSLLFTSFGLPKNVEKKVQKELEKTFQLTGFSLNPIRIEDTLRAVLPMKINEYNFFKISIGDDYLGYIFVDEALAKTSNFDYLVVFNTELKVVHTKVLVYREEYGGEIGSKRWLKQFLGKTGGDRVDYKTNIDGIAGATISVRSMTSAMDKLLQAIGILQKNKVL